MKKRFALVVVSLLASVSAAEERPMLRDREAPRATDLLRAEKLAEQARKRLEMPASQQHRPRWKRGGAAWGSEINEPVERSEPVFINVRPPVKRRGG